MRDTLESDTSHKTLGADGSRNTLVSADATDKKYKTKGESIDERMKSNMTVGSKQIELSKKELQSKIKLKFSTNVTSLN